MAKVKKSEEVVVVDNAVVVQETAEVITEETAQVVSEVVQEVVLEEAAIEEVQKVEEVVLVSSVSKMVTVKALESHTCIVAQKEYSITKGKEHKVPEDVAYILAGSLKAVITK